MSMCLWLGYNHSLCDTVSTCNQNHSCQADIDNAKNFVRFVILNLDSTTPLHWIHIYCSDKHYIGLTVEYQDKHGKKQRGFYTVDISDGVITPINYIHARAMRGL